MVNDNASDKPLVDDHEAKSRKGKAKEFPKLLTPILWPPTLFVQSLKNKSEEEEYQKLF